MEVESIGQHGCMATGSGQNVLEVENLYVVNVSKTIKRGTAVITTEHEYEIVDCLSFVMVIDNSGLPNHRRRTKWPSAAVNIVSLRYSLLHGKLT